MSEIWKPVPSVPGLLASSEGRVMVEPYQARMPGGGTRTYGGQPNFGQWAEDKQRFILRFRGKTYKVARLVCEAFHGPAPSGRCNTLHGDENSRNNKPGNLSWGTQRENLNAPGFKRYRSTRCGEFGPRAEDLW